MRRVLAATLAVALTGVLAACSTTDEPAAAPTTDASVGAQSSTPPEEQWKNQDDIMFAQMMVPHHEQAIAMADTLLAKDGVDPRVVDLATQIKAAQAPEIEQLNVWLDDWGFTASGDTHPMSHGDGMMTEADMQTLADADGPSAGRVFLEQMIVHHQGAIDMAQAEVDAGVFADAVTMAQAIIDTQTAEITTMEDLLVTM